MLTGMQAQGLEGGRFRSGHRYLRGCVSRVRPPDGECSVSLGTIVRVQDLK
jgi:hypothetical protein